MCRRGVELKGDRCTGSVLSYQVDHSLEQLKLIFGLPHAAAYNHAFPRPGAKGSSDDRFHVVAAVEAKQTGLSTYAVFGESGHSRLDRVCYWPWVPRPGNPVRIEADHEHAERGSRCVRR
jgi:hypothetical protein